jgi:5'-nucleotidase
MQLPRLSTSFAVALLGSSLLAARANFAPQEEPARPLILVTNDDGFDSPGLAALVAALSEVGEVVVSAPDGNRSGASLSTVILRGEHGVRRAELGGAAEAWAVDATPADACAFGVLHLGGERGFDLVVSGINAGPNVGSLSHYSGTVGAAMDAAGRGHLAMAVSQADYRRPGPAAEFAAAFARRLLNAGGEAGVVYNVNVPMHRGEGAQPVVVAPMGGQMLELVGVELGELKDGAGTFSMQLRIPGAAPAGSDLEAFYAGAITITPLRYDWTARSEVERLSSWDWEG